MNRDNHSGRGNGLDVGPVLFRCACFPVEMADSISSPDLTMEADSWLDREENLRSVAEGLVEELYRAVPIEPDRTLRALLLALRRALHGSLQPFPAKCSTALSRRAPFLTRPRTPLKGTRPAVCTCRATGSNSTERTRRPLPANAPLCIWLPRMMRSEKRSISRVPRQSAHWGVCRLPRTNNGGVLRRHSILI